MACPALPTCGLGFGRIRARPARHRGAIDAIFARLNLKPKRSLTLRMTGCPNGCARPYLGEIGIVGVSPDRYTVFLGGNPESTRLNRVYREGVRAGEIADLLTPLFASWAAERGSGESFGDYCLRAAWEMIAS